MPKLKTHSGTKDRVRITKNGKVLAAHPNMSHFLQKKSGSRKRSLSSLGALHGHAKRVIKQKLGA